MSSKDFPRSRVLIRASGEVGVAPDASASCRTVRRHADPFGTVPIVPAPRRSFWQHRRTFRHRANPFGVTPEGPVCTPIESRRRRLNRDGADSIETVPIQLAPRRSVRRHAGTAGS